MANGKIGLTVGVDSYPRYPLSVCAHDARELSAALSMPEYGFELISLYNENVTRKALKKALDDLFRKKADTYLFYFSGHGWATDLGVYLATVDADTDDEGIDLEYLRRLINITPPESTVIVILDCCHSGAATPRGFSSGGIHIRHEDMAKAIPSLPRDRVVLAACRSDEFSYEDATLNHGVFTFYF